MSYNNTKLLAAILGYSLLACSICGCSADTTRTTESTETSTDSSYAVTHLDSDDMFTDRDKEVGYDEETSVSVQLADSATSCSDDSVTVTDDTITISDEGTYILSGSLNDGQVIIDADENAKIQLVLDNVSINCDTSAAIYVRQADKVFVTLADDSENTLSNTSDFVAIDDNNIDGVIFSKSDLTLNGSGTLTVNAAFGHGIVSKDDLVITSGTYVITAARHALSGKDSVRIADGVLTLDAGTDGIHSENADNDGKGFIYIADGTITIKADSDGIAAEETLQIDGGSMTIAAGDDGVHSDRDLIITDGTIDVTKSYEGLEGMTVTIEDGDISVVSSDDGLNVAGDPADASSDNSDSNESNSDMLNPDDSNDTPPADGNMPSGGPQDGGFGGGMDEAHDYNFIVINGGTINVNADGDGIDSNGDLIVTGGTIYVSGPTNGGNGALDYAGNATISGGTIVAVGASGMAQNFGSDSTQGCMLVTVAESTLTGDLTLTDSDGNVIVSYSPEKAYNSVVISSPDIKKGATYTLATGDTTNTVTISSLVYGEDDHMGR